MIKRRKKLLHTSTSNRLHILNMNLEKSTFLLMSSSNLLIIIQSQLIISLVVEKSEITKNKECALYAAVRILSGAFFIYWENTFLIYKKISEYLANIEFVRYSEIKFDAAGRTRTGTATNRLILSQVRLPIPPQRLILSVHYSPNRLFNDIIFAYLFQPLFYYSPSFLPISKQSNVAK